MNRENIAARYATALYEVAFEKNSLDTAVKDMLFIEDLINNSPEIKRYCLKAHNAGSQESTFVETAFLPYVSELTKNMINTAVRNGRLPVMPLIPSAFLHIRDKRSGIASVLLETAHEPTEGLLEVVSERMRKKTDKIIKLECAVNPDLLGGFKVWYEGRLIDNSAAGRLIRMRRLLKSI